MRTNTAAKPTTTNYEGTPVKALSPEQELRRSVLSCMLFEDTFYETGADASARIAELVKKVGFEKTAVIAIEAREKMKLRHAPLLLARECARMGAGRPMGDLLYRIIQRPDELAEFLAIYWKDGKDQPLAAQVKIGLARAFRKFDAHALAKYDRPDGVKLRDVAFLAHVKPGGEKATGQVMASLVNRSFYPEHTKGGKGGKGRFPVKSSYELGEYSPLATPDTWEVELSAGKDKRETFTRLMAEGKLGALALLRNLRNMIQAGVEDAAISKGLAAMKVERVLPFRFISAAKYAPRFEPELEQAMYRCLARTAKLGGRTALVVDTSPSMWDAKISAKSEMDRFEAAAALAVLLREVCEEARVYAFNERAYEVPPRRGFALRDALSATKGGASCGGLAVDMANKAGYDRIIVLTDGQWHYSSIPGGRIDGEGDAKVVSPAPLTAKAYMVNMAATKNGVGYGKWTAIDGWSEAIVEYVRAAETSVMD